MRKLFLAAVLLMAVPAQAIAAPAGLFGSSETRNSTIGAFRKWTDMLARTTLPGAGGSAAGPEGSALANSGQCKPDSPVGCARPNWSVLMEGLKGLDRKAQMRLVNDTMNRVRYVTDQENWGVADYWETVDQFLARGAGDCEDFAIAKYMALKAAGFSPDEMRIVVLQDLNLGVPHAILAVREGNQWLILDNQIKQIMPDTAIVHYRPIYSINEKFWWLHREE
ncbi:transglutaminase-like cysteine peptidase [Pedomonas mirosovicensis]|uniref:transglutaminase-like cysteine peptidase n=1 Tax=Pedomonas mirosovicensis TaxID=2908641 RepID=UPI00216A4C03|nr:transglutaminase-like cysteine peptidase [Pedomonas mirosovicensis]MCH8684066.1 transglutaminase-like cysteine peptidase [Pedomonas mirosovicensis]